MTQTLKNFLTGANNKDFATKSGTKTHTDLRYVIVDDSGNFGNNDLIKIIQNRSDLKTFFGKDAKTEVPIAGFIKGRFASRRIDRLIINHDTKIIDFIDYKTDTDKTLFIEKYKKQLQEYAELLRLAYPGYKISGYILWLHDWELEQIVA